MTDLEVTPQATTLDTFIDPTDPEDQALEWTQDHGPWGALVFAWIKSKRSPATRRGYNMDAHQWTDWCAARGIDPMRAVRPHIDLWAQHVTREGGHSGRPASTKTLHRKLSAVASLYRYAVESRVLTESPAVYVTRPDISRDYAATLSLDEKQLKRVLEAARDESPTAGAICALLAATGLRASEALNARVTDLYVDHGHPCLKVTRKGGHDGRAVIPPDVATVLDRYIGDRTDGPLFVTAGGAALKYPALLWTLERIRRASGLTDVTRLHPHMLRASYATISFDNGVPGDRIQDGLGHADPRTTRLYDRGRGKLKRMAEPGLVVAKHVMWDVEA